MGIWVLLVIGALATFVLIALYLYRKLRTSLGQAQGALELVGEFSDAMAKAEYEPARFSPDLHAGAEQKNQWRHERRVNRMRRAQRKQVRREVTLRRWREVPTEVTRR